VLKIYYSILNKFGFIMIYLESSVLLVDGYDPETDGHRQFIDDDMLSVAFTGGTDMSVVLRVAGGIKSRMQISEGTTAVRNYMTLGNVGLRGIMNVYREGIARVVIETTAPPLEIEGQLVRLGSNPLYEGLQPDQLAFMPYGNGTHTSLDFSVADVREGLPA
jgi:hypothetical protein